MSDITINIKSNTDNIDNTIQDIVRPSIDPDNNTCLDSDNNIIYNCIIDPDTNNIKGNTDSNTKALYIYSDNTWLYGKDISKLNLISLADRTIEERQKLGSIGGKKAKENRDAKKNFNELAKALLDMTVSDQTIKQTLEDPDTMIDNSYGSLILAAMAQGAKNGSFKCAEFLRDTAGYKPKNEVEISADIMTDADRSLIDKALKTS